MIRVIGILILILNVGFLSAQKTFSDDIFYQLVVKNHPLSKQANLELEYGRVSVLKAKGGFDPKVFNNLNQKYYNSTQYYSLLDAGLKVPTWYGLELKTGFENNNGTYIDNQEKSPQGGLWYGGASLTLGQGLFIDQRRAELAKSKIFQQSTVFERQLQLNELIYEAGYSYWNWFLTHNSREVLSEALDLAQVRLQAVKQSAEYGDRPFIDSVEAKIQVQNRESLLRTFEAEQQNATNKLVTYLWEENLVPLELDSLTRPVSVDSISIKVILNLSEAIIDSTLNNHPYLQITNFKIKSLEVDQRLKKEQLKPTLNLNYNFLNEPVNYNPFNQFSVNNYKWGFNFEMPVLLRKERADFQLSNIKLQDEKLNFENNKAYLLSKIQNAYVDLKNSILQLEIYGNTVADSKRLLDAEKIMFEGGESSLFLINARETAYIQAKLKYIEALTKNQQAYLSLQFATARLFN
jgi:outer membrane protein TolC